MKIKELRDTCDAAERMMVDAGILNLEEIHTQLVEDGIIFLHRNKTFEVRIIFFDKEM